MQDGDILEVFEDGDHISLRPVPQKSVAELAGIIKAKIPLKSFKDLREQIYTMNFRKDDYGEHKTILMTVPINT